MRETGDIRTARSMKNNFFKGFSDLTGK